METLERRNLSSKTAERKMTTIEQLHARTKALEADFRAVYMDAIAAGQHEKANMLINHAGWLQCICDDLQGSQVQEMPPTIQPYHP